MGKNTSKLVPKSIKNYNIENKAFNYIEKDQKIAAPRHPQTVKILEEQAKNAPIVDELKVNKTVEEMVKAIKVEAGKLPEIKSKPLPQDRRQSERFKYGVYMPEKIAHGKVTLRTLDSLLEDYRTNRTTENKKELSKKYNLEEEKLDLLLEYYIPFASMKENEFKNDATAKKVESRTTATINAVTNKLKELS